MCGIWGVSIAQNRLDNKETSNIVRTLFLLSESRGREATGLSCVYNGKLKVIKKDVTASSFVKSKEYINFTQKYIHKSKQFVAIGHNRLATNGNAKCTFNNQPINNANLAIAHNGIIVNAEDIWENSPDLNKTTDLDSEIILKSIQNEHIHGNSIEKAVKNSYKKVVGMASVCGIDLYDNVLFAVTNNGSLYYFVSKDKKICIFASERIILETLLKRSFSLKSENYKQIFQIKPYTLVLKYLDRLESPKCCSIEKGEHTFKMRKKKSPAILFERELYKQIEIDTEPIQKLRRCKKCLLPETMPFIEFDDEGVCNYCHAYKKPSVKGEKALQKWAEKQKKIGKGNVLATFSGGRDSSYSLHYLKKELDMNVIAYSYDWGVITDLARRNQSRMCEQLGVEFIVISADIRKKRENIRKNINAWLKRPSLGMIPLFMAGDKQYFYYANQVGKANNMDVICLATNKYEQTYFKYGFCGVKPTIFIEGWNKGTEQLPMKNVLKMSSYYAKQFLVNPSYINGSLIDTISAAYSNYGIKHKFLRPFDFIDWDEKRIENVLLNEYDWETIPDVQSTWRIGDGTAPFYNYIYYTVCGFTENDCLRSNQIRAGKISREEGEMLVKRDNAVQYNGLKWYFDMLGLDMLEVLSRVQKIPKAYKV